MVFRYCFHVRVQQKQLVGVCAVYSKEGDGNKEDGLEKQKKKSKGEAIKMVWDVCAGGGAGAMDGGRWGGRKGATSEFSSLSTHACA